MLHTIKKIYKDFNTNVQFSINNSFVSEQDTPALIFDFAEINAATQLVRIVRNAKRSRLTMKTSSNI